MMGVSPSIVTVDEERAHRFTFLPSNFPLLSNFSHQITHTNHPTHEIITIILNRITHTPPSINQSNDSPRPSRQRHKRPSDEPKARPRLSIPYTRRSKQCLPSASAFSATPVPIHTDSAKCITRRKQQQQQQLFSSPDTILTPRLPPHTRPTRSPLLSPPPHLETLPALDPPCLP